MNLNDLNERQKEAVLYNEGPLLIIKNKSTNYKDSLFIRRKRSIAIQHIGDNFY